MTTETAAPTSAEWEKLYDAADRLKKVAPWEWMEETELFGVQDPESSQLGFVSVMGMLGEHLSVTLYQGAKALYAFWSIQEMGPAGNPEAILNVPQLQLSFEDRDLLSKEDRAVIKKLGRKYRGRQAWPQFRSYKAGHYPWYLTGPEVRQLTAALEQTLQVTPRFADDPDLLYPDDEDDQVYLVRVPTNDGEWEDKIITVLPPDLDPIDIMMNQELLDTVKTHPQVGNTLEVDFFMFMAPVQEDEAERPFFPFLLLAVDADSGMVIGSDMLSPQEGMSAMWGQVPLHLVQLFNQHEIIPYEIHTSNPMLASLLQTLAEELGYGVELTAELPMLDEAREALLNQFM